MACYAVNTTQTKVKVNVTRKGKTSKSGAHKDRSPLADKKNAITTNISAQIGQSFKPSFRTSVCGELG